ncbi:HDOD domain-containing protein [Rhodoferax sp. OV413]|uniref:HDOD domain-containing protein n=1 Tax=Rhodoferax sp. OV413 TaxID=1855285 RepID=UPI0025E86AC9|nr:HDOD domain-containing protein [Rhodoferax sp. OV413]
MNAAMSDRITAAVEAMPAFPKSVQKILVLTRDINSPPKDLVGVIGKDPVLTVKILRVVNSAYYSLPKQITSIGHAVVFLGFNTIKNLALSIAAIGMLPDKNDAGFDSHAYFMHSLVTAGIAKRLAAKTADADPMDCFSAGLLHDFGKIVFTQYLPQEFKRALETSAADGSSLHLALQAFAGADHAEVGAMLLEKWRFAPAFVDVIRHQQPDSLTDSGMAACVFAANQISKRLGLCAGNEFVAALPSHAQMRLGGNLDELTSSLGDITRIVDEATVFARL